MDHTQRQKLGQELSGLLNIMFETLDIPWRFRGQGHGNNHVLLSLEQVFGEVSLETAYGNYHYSYAAQFTITEADLREMTRIRGLTMDPAEIEVFFNDLLPPTNSRAGIVGISHQRGAIWQVSIAGHSPEDVVDILRQATMQVLETSGKEGEHQLRVLLAGGSPDAGMGNSRVN